MNPVVFNQIVRIFIRYTNVDVGVAVNSDQGIMAPIVFRADQKGLTTISAEMKSYVARAREGSLQPHECQVSTAANIGL